MGHGPLQAWFLAACHGELDTIKKFLTNGKVNDVNTKDYMNYSCSALHHATQNGQTKVVQFLLEAKADVKQRENRGFIHCLFEGPATDGNIIIRNTPLHFASSLRPGKRRAEDIGTSIIRILIDAKASVNERNGQGKAPLHCAALNANAGCAKLLLDAKADPDCKDSDGNTPGDLASASLEFYTKGKKSSDDGTLPPPRGGNVELYRETIEILEGGQLREDSPSMEIKQGSDEEVVTTSSEEGTTNR